MNAQQASSSFDSPTPPAASLHWLRSIQPTTAEAWDRLGDHLSVVLDALEEDEYLILMVKRSSYFVQFAGQGALGLRVEAVSSFYLPERETLSEAQHEALLKLGWHAPTKLPDLPGIEHEPDGSPNYFLDLASPVDAARVAVIATNTLRHVFGASHPGRLEYRAFAEDGTSIRFPTLGIRRAAP